MPTAQCQGARSTRHLHVMVIGVAGHTQGFRIALKISMSSLVSLNQEHRTALLLCRGMEGAYLGLGPRPHNRDAAQAQHNKRIVPYLNVFSLLHAQFRSDTTSTEECRFQCGVLHTVFGHDRHKGLKFHHTCVASSAESAAPLYRET